jgi:hypothetical protein
VPSTSAALAIGVEDDAGTIEHQAIVASDLVHHGHRHAIIARNGRQHLAAQLAFADPERRGRYVEHKVAACFQELFDRICGIEPPPPKMSVIPRVFADRQRHLLPAKRKQLLLAGRSEVTRFVKDVVSRQQFLGLQEFEFAILEQGGGIHDRLPGVGICRCDQAADYRDAAGLGGNAIHGFAVPGDEGWPFHQVAGRVSTNGKFGKQNQSRSRGLGAPRKVDDFGSVTAEIINRGIDLTERDPHVLKCKAGDEKRSNEEESIQQLALS